MAIGGVSKRWSTREQRRLKWFPKIVDLPSPNSSSSDDETTNNTSNANNNTTTSTMLLQEDAATLQRYGYYTFVDPRLVLVPFHCLKGENLGHLLWDSYLPIFHLLKLFDLIPPSNINDDNDHNDDATTATTSSSTTTNTSHSPQQQQQRSHHPHLLLIRYLLRSDLALKGTCEGAGGKPGKCARNFQKTLPHMWGIPPEALRTNQQSVLHHDSNHDNKNDNNSNDNDDGLQSSPFVCAPTAVAGMGVLQDHGMKLHGEIDSDYLKGLHNYGRGDTLWAFRNFLLGNLNNNNNNNQQDANVLATSTTTMKTTTAASQMDTIRVVFSIHSSTDKKRRHDFAQQIEALKRYIATNEGDNNNNNVRLSKKQTKKIEIQAIQLSNYSMPQQMKLLSQTCVLISACGGGASTALFLPKGASLVLFFNDRAPTKTGPRLPARLDSDYFQNLGYLNVHWLPSSSMMEENDLNLFTTLLYSQIVNLASSRRVR